MATTLERPGVQVIQKFQTTSPTIVRPTLVPCMVAPFFEVIEATKKDGTLNANAKLSTTYEQTTLTVGQSSFPSPRGNIAEVDVTESKIRVFFSFGGSLSEIKRTSGFLRTYKAFSTQATLVGTSAAATFDLKDRTLILALDAHKKVGAALPEPADVPATANVTVTFSKNAMTIAEVVTEVNALLPKVASAGTAGDAGKLVLTSTVRGAGSSIVVRKTGSANALLGFSFDNDRVAVGAGFYAEDDGDGDLVSPRLKIFGGTTIRNLVATTANTDVAVPPNFQTDKLEIGDELVVDGVNAGAIDQVHTDHLVMKVEQGLLSSSKKFAPGYAWIKGQSLSYPAPAASTKGSLTGTVQAAAATQAYIAGAADPTSTVAGESMTINWSKAGAAQTPLVINVPTGGWANLAAMVTGINADAGVVAALNPIVAYKANKYGDEVTLGTRLGLRVKTDNTGSQGSLTMASKSPAMNNGFTAGASDVGENQRYLIGTAATLTSAGFNATGIGAVVVEVTNRGTGLIDTDSFTLAGANLAAVVIDWNAKALYTKASASGAELKIETLGENVGTGAKLKVTTASTTGLPANTLTPGTSTDLNGKTFKWLVDLNGRVYSVTFASDEDDSGVSFQQVLDKINGQTVGVAASDGSSPAKLKLSSQIAGGPGEIKIGDATSTANAILGFTNDASGAGAGRPAADLGIDTAGAAVIQGQVLRDARTGDPFNSATAILYFAYQGLRLDLTPSAKEPALLTVADPATLEKVADPISTDNPGALMLYLGLLNAPNTTVAAIGVPETSADLPDGTPKGYAKAFKFLETQEVYALACASQDPNVHGTGATHVTSMSKPENKGERIIFINPKIPARAVPKLVGSGTDANSTGIANEVVVEVNLGPALTLAGLDPAADINPTSGAITNEVYLDLGGDSNAYLVQKVVNGTKLLLRTAFVSTDGNSDSFYASSALSTAVISDDWAVYIRGKKLVLTGTTLPDNDLVADAVQKTAAAYQNRRLFFVFPDTVGINVTGVEQKVAGYYATACVAGMVAQQPPQQGFTNFPITGLTRAVGSHDRFSEGQMSVMAAGGVYILLQDAKGAPVICRHQLSTDLTSIETRELSITKVVDYSAKFLRAALRNFIGRANITQAFLDQLSSVVEGCLSFLRETGVLVGAELNNLLQDADQPDQVICDISVDPPYPCNTVRVTLIV